MILIGKTLKELDDFLENNTVLTAEENLLVKRATNWLRRDEFDLTQEEEYDAVSGGFYFIVEDTPEDFKEMKDYALPELLLPYSSDNGGMDFCEYLDHDFTMACVGVATNNSGGNSYIIRKFLLDKYPTIREHIRHAQDWLHVKTDEEFNREQHTVVDLRIEESKDVDN